MKIIKVDNFNRDIYDDVLVCENVKEYFGNVMVDALNDRFSGENSQDYFRLVNDDYILNKYEW